MSAGVRGSAGDSIEAYCLGITKVDPIAHKLLFERAGRPPGPITSLA